MQLKKYIKKIIIFGYGHLNRENNVSRLILTIRINRMRYRFTVSYRGTGLAEALVNEQLPEAKPE